MMLKSGDSLPPASTAGDKERKTGIRNDRIKGHGGFNLQMNRSTPSWTGAACLISTGASPLVTGSIF